MVLEFSSIVSIHANDQSMIYVAYGARLYCLTSSIDVADGWQSSTIPIFHCLIASEFYMNTSGRGQLVLAHRTSVSSVYKVHWILSLTALLGESVAALILIFVFCGVVSKPCSIDCPERIKIKRNLASLL